MYAQRLQTCSRDASKRRRQHLFFGYVRLGWAASLLAIAWYVFARHGLTWQWLLLPWIGFGVTAHFHAQVLAAGARSRRAMAWYEHGLTRITDRWSGLRPRPVPGTVQAAADDSLYAHDLDLFREGGLFELLCTARTTCGEETLARWLLASAPLDVVGARQAAVADLRDRLRLREDTASLPGPETIRIDRDALLAWAELPQPALPSPLRWLAPLLAALTILAALRWYAAQSPVLFALAIVMDASLAFFLQRRLRTLFAGAEKAAGPLAGLSALLELLESETFAAPLLLTLQAGLRDGIPASRAVRRLATLTRAMELRGNPLLRLLNVPLLFSVQLGAWVQAWREQHGSRLRVWFEAVGQIEALLSLSAYHFEHPDDRFPELISAATPDRALFDAAALGHPLLTSAACVRNDVLLDEHTRLLLVSGSNMSGKSTLLRSVGVATVMALAGSPVRARHLRLSFFQVAASIQVNDSLQNGRSRFYAEILRLRAICETARQRSPVLFLLDELLAGTNSHDRVAGASGIVRELLAAKAIGLLSTHDLALAAMPEPEASLIRNAHFEDQVSDEKLTFDYTLREGVVTRSNGLALMRMIGLDV